MRTDSIPSGLFSTLRVNEAVLKFTKPFLFEALGGLRVNSNFSILLVEAFEMCIVFSVNVDRN
jgi:hypothetical protein